MNRPASISGEPRAARRGYASRPQVRSSPSALGRGRECPRSREERSSHWLALQSSLSAIAAATGLIAFMPLVPIGFGLVAAGVMLALRVSSGWIAAVVVGSIIIAGRRVPLVLFWMGRISKQQAALLYAGVLPVALLMVSIVTGGSFWSWPLVLAVALLFLVSYGTALGIFAVLKVGMRRSSSDPNTPREGRAEGQKRPN